MRSVLITGCSSGIGYHAAHAMAARLASAGHLPQPDDCARLQHEGLDSLPLDLTDRDSIHAAVAEALDRTGGQLDALFNNGAFALPGAVEDLPTDGLRALFETNLFGWHELTRAVIPVMRAQGHGRIVQNSSVLGLAALKWRGAYVASKFALEGLSDVMRLELAGTGIHVALIEPGPITSRIRENSIPQFERWIDWENSPRAAQYRDSLLARLYDKSGPDFFELPPEKVTQTPCPRAGIAPPAGALPGDNADLPAGGLAPGAAHPGARHDLAAPVTRLEIRGRNPRHTG